jgi:hypothetical protein
MALSPPIINLLLPWPVDQVYQHNWSLESRAWLEGLHLCEVCYCDKTGREFAALTCGHRFCCECLSSIARIHIDEGSIHSLRCPQPDCAQDMHPDVIRDLVGLEKYQRWEALMLKRVRGRGLKYT